MAPSLPWTNDYFCQLVEAYSITVFPPKIGSLFQFICKSSWSIPKASNELHNFLLTHGIDCSSKSLEMSMRRHTTTVKGLLKNVKRNKNALYDLLNRDFVFPKNAPPKPPKQPSPENIDTVGENKRILKQDMEDKAKTKTMSKINERGEYLPFYGYTIVSHVADPKNYEFIEGYIRKSKTLRKYISALPFSSYHVTIFDIFSERNIPEKYTPKSGSVPSEDWLKVMDSLNADLSAAQKMCDEVEFDKYFWPTSFSGKSVLCIAGNLTDEGAVSDLRQQYLSIFQSTTRPNLKYHLTLGYFYRSVSEQDKKRYQKELDNLWKLLPEHFELEKPAVCYFKSMEAFVPITKR